VGPEFTTEILLSDSAFVIIIVIKVSRKECKSKGASTTMIIVNRAFQVTMVSMRLLLICKARFCSGGWD
jgi:hypothetical protein